jgi:hypothetical protein
MIIQNALDFLVFSRFLSNEIQKTATNYYTDYCRQNISCRRYELRILERRAIGDVIYPSLVHAISQRALPTHVAHTQSYL